MTTAGSTNNRTLKTVKLEWPIMKCFLQSLVEIIQLSAIPMSMIKMHACACMDGQSVSICGLLNMTMPQFTQLELFSHGLKCMKVNSDISPGQHNHQIEHH
jgi:hypothetical protein